MKRMFTSLLLIAGLCTQVNAGVICSPDSSLTEFGFYPDSAGFADGCEGDFYSQSFTVVVDDSFEIDAGPTVAIDSISVTGVNNLPLGLFTSCNPQACDFPANSLGCIAFNGTPTIPGTYGISVNVTIFYETGSVDTV